MSSSLGKPRRTAPSVICEDIDHKWLNGELRTSAQYELVFIEAGAGHWQIGSAHGPFGPGTFVLCPPRALRAWRIAAGADGRSAGKGIALRFAAPTLPKALLLLPEMEALRRLLAEASSGLIFTVADRERLRTRLRSIDRTVGALRLARLYVVLELTASYSRKQVSAEQGLASEKMARSSARFESVKRFIEARCAGPLTRAEAAAQAGMEEAAFSRFFRTASGTTFADYLASLRIRRAATLLGSRRDLSTPEIARQSGYGNVGAFHRQFKKRLGTTPQAYRKAANSEPLAP